MEISTIIGIALGAISLVMGFILEGGHVGSLLQPTAAIIVLGGTAGATLASFSLQEFLVIPQLIKVTITKKLFREIDIIEQIVKLSEKARREGLLYLENHLEEIEDPFLRRGLQLVIDGTETELVRSILETEIYAIRERHQLGISIFEVAGGYAPTMGIIGTVMGLVHVLGNLSSPEKLGPSIAMAFIATLYGVSTANIIWLPIAEKLRNLSKKETMLCELTLEGLISLQAGNNPILIRERLIAFLRKPAKNEKQQQQAGGEGEVKLYEEAS